MATVYVETTIIGYLTSRPSRDLVVAAHQQITREWWDLHRTTHDLFVSEAVVAECSTGDPQAAQERLDRLSGISVLDVTADVESLAEALAQGVPLPAKAAVDALHIALGTVHGMDFVLTWNCTHIANAALQHKIEAVCHAAGYNPPVICTPEQLMKG